MRRRAFVVLLALSTVLVASSGTAQGGLAPAACRTVDKLVDTEPFTKKERRSIASAARSLRKVTSHAAKKFGASLLRAKTDKKRAAVLENAYEWCDLTQHYGTTAAPTRTTLSPTPAIGSPVTGTYGTITVYSLEFPVVGSGSAEQIKTPGTSFAVADVEVCPSIGPVTVLELDFRVTTADNRQWEAFNTQVGARDPRFGGDELPAGLCDRGWITFEVGDGSTVTGIFYEGGNHWNGASPISEESIVWRV